MNISSALTRSQLPVGIPYCKINEWVIGSVIQYAILGLPRSNNLISLTYQEYVCGFKNLKEIPVLLSLKLVSLVIVSRLIIYLPEIPAQSSINSATLSSEVNISLDPVLPSARYNPSNNNAFCLAVKYFHCLFVKNSCL